MNMDSHNIHICRPVLLPLTSPIAPFQCTSSPDVTKKKWEMFWISKFLSGDLTCEIWQVNKVEACVHFSSLTHIDWLQHKWELFKRVVSVIPWATRRCMPCSGPSRASGRTVRFAGPPYTNEFSFFRGRKQTSPATFPATTGPSLLMCSHLNAALPVWCSPLALAYAHSQQRHWCCSPFLHTGAEDNLSTDCVYDELILLLSQHLSLVCLTTRQLQQSGRVSKVRWCLVWVLTLIWIHNQHREPCSVICL